MRVSKYLLPTTKEDPADAVVASHKLMVRAGFIRKSHSGLYYYLPLGLRVIKKIESIIRQEMDLSGALEFELPILSPAELWSKSGRWDKMGKEMFRQTDRHGVEYSLGPTHEESFTGLLKGILKSYKELPINVYQIHTKFRDEVRPRFGVIRSREFTMKDAYSFHIDDKSLDETYQLMRKTYRRIFKRCGLETIPVQADSGSMGGSGSEEFMVVSPIGEETLSVCPSCGYSGNVEKTPVIYPKTEPTQNQDTIQEIHTPKTKTIEDLSKLLHISAKETLKAVFFKADEERYVVVFIRGDRDINEVKLKNHIGATEVRSLSEAEAISLQLVPGFTGPYQLADKSKYSILFDQSVNVYTAYITGANKLDYHIRNFIPQRDFQPLPTCIDLAITIEGDPCPSCGSPLKLEKGIEVGHIFKLGNKYTKAFDLKVSDANGKMTIPTMGCYGIGVNRTMATVIEQANDDKGILWPISIAPFEVSLISISKTDAETSVADELYQFLLSKNIEVLYDDRKESPGFKLRDSEIIGIPIRIVFGKKFTESNQFSITLRKTGEEIFYPYTSKEQVYELVQGLISKLYEEVSV
jgi:prolyl-tRNA synthetase